MSARSPFTNVRPSGWDRQRLLPMGSLRVEPWLAPKRLEIWWRMITFLAVLTLAILETQNILETQSGQFILASQGD